MNVIGLDKTFKNITLQPLTLKQSYKVIAPFVQKLVIATPH